MVLPFARTIQVAGVARRGQHDNLVGRASPSRARCKLSVSSAALGRRRRPALDQRVVVDRLALRLLVGELRLGRDVAVLLGLLEPVLAPLSSGSASARIRPARSARSSRSMHGVLRRGQRVHRLLRRLRAGRGVADVLPPELRQLRVVRAR